ncbi:phospholipid:diacylglycerol acyltransferase [Dimargaris verticillata]|uniref:Phospholipid:diacylglycerol acyltransferase n=1 Tax=Dimargaris verticillata TaxID=2761393 RepID=A0A9W8E8L6_9FUNG|nr:phospholipid:diacylglycerol acyltransferase [Dimargaris verticillata]
MGLRVRRKKSGQARASSATASHQVSPELGAPADLPTRVPLGPDSVGAYGSDSTENGLYSAEQSPRKLKSSAESLRWSPESAKGGQQQQRPRFKRELSAESVFYESVLQRELSGRPLHQRKRSWFVIGLLLGVVLAFGLVSVNTRHHQYIERLSDYVTMSLADVDLRSLLPTNLMVDDILGNLTRLMESSGPGLRVGDFLPGLDLVQTEQLSAHFPVVLIPGTISTGLESWGTSNCSQRYFRQRMWGTMTMFRAVLLDKECWVDHMRLDMDTGLDPPGIKLRAAQGLDAADYFVSGYWVWGKIIENLAVLGYDNNNMHLAAYDWRLGYSDLERRDRYFSKLKQTFELSLRHTGRKSVVVTHSMGSNVFLYFMHWVESPLGGASGSGWVDRHIETFVNIAGPMLGVAKSVASLLSGEQRETVQPLGAYVLERFFNKQERADLFRSWAGLGSLLPRGGDRIWGNATWAPDDALDQPTLDKGKPLTFGTMLIFPEHNTQGLGNATLSESLDLLRRSVSPAVQQRLDREYSFGLATEASQLEANEARPQTWSNPLESQLPRAPSMKIYCLYGIGKETERGYFYTDGHTRHSNGVTDHGRTQAHPADAAARDQLKQAHMATDTSGPPPSVFIDVSVHRPELGTDSGVRVSEGDGTVPLLSLGYMCVDGWQQPRYNPSHIPVVTREYMHNPIHMIHDLRGGSETSDHVDILGNYHLTRDLLRIVAGKADTVQDHVMSDIREFAQRIHL